jgi:protein-S-isoprenylcysteine O-methyltransferase Ste14
MRLLYTYLFPLLWMTFLLYWQIMAVNVKATQRVEPAATRIIRGVLFLSAAVLLICPRMPVRWLYWQIFPVTTLSCLGGAAITASGFFFSIWARIHLGRNWSRSVTIKEDHELIVTGPYAFARHPIYTGLFISFFGTAIADAQLRGILAFSMIFIALWTKLRREEQWMRDRFGTSYDLYSNRVAALVPFFW